MDFNNNDEKLDYLISCDIYDFGIDLQDIENAIKIKWVEYHSDDIDLFCSSENIDIDYSDKISMFDMYFNHSFGYDTIYPERGSLNMGERMDRER